MTTPKLPQFPRWFRPIDRRLAHVPTVLWIAFRQFTSNRSVEAAASIAYFFLFSLFPLLIVLVVVGSFFLEEEAIRHELINGLYAVIPTATDFIQQNVDVVIASRRPAGITAIVGLIWAGTGAFNVLARNINRAWQPVSPRGILYARLVALAMVILLAIIMFIGLFFSTAISLIPPVANLLHYSSTQRPALVYLRNLVFPSLLAWLLFSSLYRWIPRADVHWHDALWGGLVAMLGWRLVVTVFSWYLTSGLLKFQVIYGSLGAVVALLLWVYISSLFVLFGAHVSASIAFLRRHRPPN